jgi:hypothetical protein
MTAQELGITQHFITKNFKRIQIDNWVVNVGETNMRFDLEDEAIRCFGRFLTFNASPRAYFIYDNGSVEDFTEDFGLKLYEPKPEAKRSVFDRVMDFIGL